MARVNLEGIKTRLAALPQVDATAVQQAIKDLGKDGAITASDRAVLDAFLPKMTADAKARYAFLTGTQQATSGAAATLGAQAGFSDVAAGTAVLERGAKGPAVKRLQEALLRLNFGAWTPTETFGPKTEQALKEFQVHCNDKFAGTTAPQAAKQLTVDGKLNAATLKALDAELAAMPVDTKVGGGLDKLDVIVDLTKNRAYVNAALVDPAKLTDLLKAMGAEAKGPNATAMYAKLASKVAPNGTPVDDYDVLPVKTEAELGLKDSDGEARTFVSFVVATGAVENGAPLTPTGSFVVGEKRRNREATQYNHPKGFNEDTANPFGPRWMRLFREMPNGAPGYTAYGLHGTTGDATWMKKPDGARAVSHGCVRFQNEDIVRMFQYLPMGARVRIVGGLPDVKQPLPPNV